MRFHFPRVVAAIFVVRADLTFERNSQLQKMFEERVFPLFPSNTTIHKSWGQHQPAQKSADCTEYGMATVCETDCTSGPCDHTELLETVAVFAGKKLDVPESIATQFSCFSVEDKDGRKIDVDPDMRWYLHLWNRGHFEKLDFEMDGLITMQLCEDVFGASWTLLSKMGQTGLHQRSVPLDRDEEEIVELIEQVGHRLTTSEILSEFACRDQIKAESTIKAKLGRMVKSGHLNNRQDTQPYKGYGLPEWQ